MYLLASTITTILVFFLVIITHHTIFPRHKHDESPLSPRVVADRVAPATVSCSFFSPTSSNKAPHIRMGIPSVPAGRSRRKNVYDRTATLHLFFSLGLPTTRSPRAPTGWSVSSEIYSLTATVIGVRPRGYPSRLPHRSPESCLEREYKHSFSVSGGARMR